MIFPSSLDENAGHPATAGEAATVLPAPAVSEPELEALRDILFSHYRQRIAQLETEVSNLEQLLSNQDQLTAAIAPGLGDAIRRKIREDREEMITTLYPIIGQLIGRAVAEAIRGLARNIDTQMRTSFSLSALRRRWWARAHGVSNAEMVLRDSLPFQVSEVFLIHRETGLLLRHVSQNEEYLPNSELISSLLTAIRDFAREAFGRGGGSQLDEIQYGKWRILIEAAHYTYLAVVIDGIDPSDFRAKMRELVTEIEYAHEKNLRYYEGNSTFLASADVLLRSLLAMYKL